MLQLTCLFLFLVASATSDCPPESIYESYFNKCYQFVSTPKSFLDAEVYCNALGGHLAEEGNAFENSYIAKIVTDASSQTSNFWIGANLLRSSSWSWTSNTPLGYTNWANGQPNNAYPCADVKVKDLTWVTNNCNTPLPFVCTISPNATATGSCSTQKPPSTTSPSPSVGICDNGYTQYSGNMMCYKYYQNYFSFTQANATCTRDGGMLATVPSKNVNDFLSALPGFQTTSRDSPYIGLTCTMNNPKSCYWADGSPLGNYSNFYYMDNQFDHYVLVSFVTPRNEQDGMWDYANDQRAFLCQKASTSLSLLGVDKKETDASLELKKERMV